MVFSQDGTHIRWTENVELSGGSGDENWEFYADQVDLYTDESRLVATGNVVFSSGGGRVAAERAEFNIDDNTGTFFEARGSTVLVEDVVPSMFGTSEPEMLFWGEIMEKTGPRTYKLTRGGFTSCVQPTPRWEVRASSVTINLDQYAMLRSAVLRVKGVPLFYLPALYYPIQADDRATGILMPTYGASTIRGNSISNAFFWAINRSHDATIFHDLFTSTGQGFGGDDQRPGRVRRRRGPAPPRSTRDGFAATRGSWPRRRRRPGRAASQRPARGRAVRRASRTCRAGS